jgi:hypothetical protein
MPYYICIQYRVGGTHWVLLQDKDGKSFDIGAYRSDGDATNFANDLAMVLKKPVRHIADGK